MHRKPAIDPFSFVAPERTTEVLACPRCGRSEMLEQLLETVNVVFRRCGECGHVWVARLKPSADSAGRSEVGVDSDPRGESGR